MSELRVRLDGPAAHLGEIPAADVGRLLIGIERAVARAAEIRLRRLKKRGGRREAAVEAAARIRLIAVKDGSVTPVLDVPSELPSDETLSFEVAHLSEDAVEILMDELQNEVQSRKYVARSLAELSRELGIGDRYESLTLDFKRSGARRKAVIDSGVRERLERNAGLAEPTESENIVTGTLMEADFEKHTARLRRPEGDSVTVKFPPNLEDEVQSALREQASLEGTVSYDPDEMSARSIKLRTIERPRQLVTGLDPHAFWRFESFEDLARYQNVPLEPFDPGSIYDAEATEEERDALQEAIADSDQ